jgi:hypothetical protein
LADMSRIDCPIAVGRRSAARLSAVDPELPLENVRYQATN